MTGEKILNYRIENFTEENQLFRSFLATHTQFAKKVIIKTLKPLKSFQEKADFLDEIKHLALLQHPNVITLYDHLETAQEFYLVFEYVQGKTLADFIRYETGPIPEEKALPLIAKIVEAFAIARQKGLGNGAINPSNILISQEGQVKILDLALSHFFKHKLIEAQDKETLAYCSPEEIAGQAPDVRSDVYALGILLFQMLTGRNPYEGFNLPETRLKIVQSPLPPITKYYPMVSAGVQAFVNQATHKDPQNRFSSLEAMLAALPPSGATQALSELKTSPPVVQKSPQKATPFPEKEDWKEAQSVNLPLILLLVFGGFLTILLVYYAVQRPPEDTEVLYEIKDVERIERLQDSIARAQAQQAIEDSIRRFSAFNRKDTVAIFIHKIQRGEDLASIAKLYFQPLDTLKKLNGLKGKERLRPREGIKVKVRQIYKIQRGEDLFQIGRKFNISPNVLRDVNRLYPKAPEPGEEPQPLVYEGKDIVIPLITVK
ncbi:MAG: protein kinase [Microscillaceae bacterium]|nr:protein kinase [Microscillaceae bacterium]